jgi:hypothetical protein
MAGRSYYTLMASLPALPRLEKAKVLPINEVRLRERLTMLHEEDAVLVRETTRFLRWQRQPVQRTDREIVLLFERILNKLQDHEAIAAMVTLRMDVRTVMAALRRRHLGIPRPEKGEIWGTGEWTRPIMQNWDDPDFKLGYVFPWISRVRNYLEKGETVELEKQLMHVVWNRAEQLAFLKPFGFDSLIAYLFKWDILQRWLSFDKQEAKKRFKSLVLEVMSGRN